MDLSDLRLAAIEAVHQRDLVPDGHSKTPVKELIHEIRVHQAELEMQNEELLRVQSELEASRDKFVGLFDCAPVGYMTINSSNRIVEANTTIANLLGVPREQLPTVDLSAYVFVDDVGELHQHLEGIERVGRTTTCELRLKSSTAGLIDVRLSSSRVDGETCRIAVVDLRENVDLLRAKQDSEQRLRVISSALPVPIAYLDRSGTYKMHNSAHQAWSGKSVVGLDARDCFSEKNYSTVQQKIRHVLAGQSCSCQLHVKHGQTGMRFVEMRLAPHRDANHNVVGCYEVLQDLTLQQQVEEAETQRGILLAQLETLSKGHRDIFDSLIAGKSNKLIATELDLGSRTVERARHNILRHLKVGSINELLVRFAPVVSGSPVCPQGASEVDWRS